MWKIVVGFAIFAALAVYLLTKGGNIDMGGEKHEVAPAGHEAPASAATAASAPTAAASK